MNTKAEIFFEVSWEVCNKVGGIYTVITSKIPQMKKYYKEKYFTIGPYFPTKTISGEFQRKEVPEFLKPAFDELKKQGIECHYGIWLTDGEPHTILIDYSGCKDEANDIKGKLWEQYKIDSLNSKYHDFDEPVLWSTCVGRLLQQIKENMMDKEIVAQMHEWMAGAAILYLKSRNVKIGTVFTTHATMLGRTLAANDVDLYGQLNNLNPKEEAYKYGVQDKYLTERACAKNADVFTTVSEITGIEATAFFGKKPDVLLFNGIDTHLFPTFDDASVQHKMLKSKIKRFLMFYFFPYYQFELEDTLIFFLAGRYEFKNKGIDVYLDALGKLNEKLKKEKSDKTVIAFIWVPGPVTDIKQEILENRTFFEDIEDSVHDVVEGVKERIVYGLTGKKKIDEEFLLGTSLLKQTSRKLARFKREGNPPVCTHDLNTNDDIIMNTIFKNNLHNTSEDKVKVIFYPIYLTGADRLTDLTYYEAIMASHLGVFPSYYEPWGYTPMEAGALGIASVTTDLSGFGRYLQKEGTDKKNPGVYVMKREGRKYDELVNNLVDIFKKFTDNTKQDRIENKLNAKNLSDKADWNVFAQNYIKAHNLAVDKNS